MAEASVRVNLDGLGKKIRTEELTVGVDLVEQQVVTLADSTGALLDTQLSNLNLSLTALRDSITAAGAAAKTLADVVTAISGTLKENLTQVGGTTLPGPTLGVNIAPLLGDGRLGEQVLGAQTVWNVELFRARFALQVLLAQFGIFLDLTALKGTEGI